MFFGDERMPFVVGMILAKDTASREKYLEKLLGFQMEDFKGILKAMQGFPVTIRTLDPPLHEFLPKTQEEAVRRASALGVDAEELWAKSRSLHEANPMLGFRGARLGIVFPEITAMQGKAIVGAAAQLRREGVRAMPEIMVPLVGFIEEFLHQRRVLDETRKWAEQTYKVKLSDIAIGTMIEVPRAALRAEEIARHADFFSFGTNDLTQMSLGYSRDDYGHFIGEYLSQNILPYDPFITIDTAGVGSLIAMAVKAARKVKPKMKIGVCGEHGGDPESIAFFTSLGFSYVSSSTYRVPVAKLAVARSCIARSKGVKLSETK